MQLRANELGMLGSAFVTAGKDLEFIQFMLAFIPQLTVHLEVQVTLT